MEPVLNDLPATPPAAPGCQLQGLAGVLGSRPPSLEEPLAWYLRRHVGGAALRLWKEAGERVLGVPAQPAAAPPRDLPAPELSAGDRVRVRDLPSIRATLDAKGTCGGCGFVETMSRHCGQELRVVRRVERFFDEGRWRMMRGRRLVLLEGAHCDGAALAATGGCDRMCYYFWRTEWLEKVAP